MIWIYIHTLPKDRFHQVQDFQTDDCSMLEDTEPEFKKIEGFKIQTCELYIIVFEA